MHHRYELPQEQWERIARFFPHPRHHDGRGRPWEDHHRILNGILWRLHTGAPWRDIPERYGPWETVYSRFRRWRRDGTWANLLTRLLEGLEQQDRLGHELWLVDATVIRASRAAGGAKKKSRTWCRCWAGRSERNWLSRLNMRSDTRRVVSAPR